MFSEIIVLNIKSSLTKSCALPTWLFPSIIINGARSAIRTQEPFARLRIFKTRAFNHSAKRAYKMPTLTIVGYRSMPLDNKRGDLYNLLLQFEIEIKVISDIETL